jgi:8-amino-7-oxononanoate synthase
VSAAIEIMLDEPERIKHLWDLTKYAQQAFISAGIDTGKSETPIIPLYVKDDMKVLKLARILLDEGVFVNPVISPAVSKENALIRFSLMATHSYEQLDEAIEKINRAFKELNVAPCFQSIE